jgi:hypothetical protein
MDGLHLFGGEEATPPVVPASRSARRPFVLGAKIGEEVATRHKF